MHFGFMGVVVRKIHSSLTIALLIINGATTLNISKRLPHPMFTDTLLSGTASQRGHKFAQVLETSYGWSCTIPTTKKSDAPFALDRLFRHDGVPPEMIMDGSK